MKKNSLYYFKRALMLSIPMAIFVIVRDLFDLELYNSTTILKTFAKGLFVGIITGLILGIINIFAKVDTLIKKE
ncbi:hypothetical protein [Winogradskyella helgolandensis]|uniref:hypothetical protein n=1 Tax=Winogradskyella helgolandensis TaxID=2697010 RepID=UPI0015C16CFD|nr:hypothetical protein [Winogradskyella helgolandensis]